MRHITEYIITFKVLVNGSAEDLYILYTDRFKYRKHKMNIDQYLDDRRKHYATTRFKDYNIDDIRIVLIFYSEKDLIIRR